MSRVRNRQDSEAAAGAGIGNRKTRKQEPNDEGQTGTGRKGIRAPPTHAGQLPGLRNGICAGRGRASPTDKSGAARPQTTPPRRGAAFHSRFRHSLAGTRGLRFPWKQTLRNEGEHICDTGKNRLHLSRETIRPIFA